jgi:AraC-like DNA-binding protein
MSTALAEVTPIRFSPCEQYDEIVERTLAYATIEGKTDTPISGLTFHRFSTSLSCTKGFMAGATLVVVLKGRKVVRLRGGELSADKMRYLVITRETSFESAVEEEGPRDPYLSISLTFPPEMIVKALVALAEAGETVPQEEIPAFVSTVESGIGSAILRLVRTLDDPVERKLFAPLIMEECALRLLRCDAAAAMRHGILAGGDAITVESAMRFMRSNAGRPLSVPQIARHVGMSPSHFAHRFRDVARVTPMRFLRQVRLSDARSLMLTEGTRPSEAASRVGFESTSHFTREFKRHYGASPAEYVRRFR